MESRYLRCRKLRRYRILSACWRYSKAIRGGSTFALSLDRTRRPGRGARTGPHEGDCASPLATYLENAVFLLYQVKAYDLVPQRQRQRSPDAVGTQHRRDALSLPPYRERHARPSLN